MTNLKTAVIIVAKNEDQTIGRLIDEAKLYADMVVTVCDTIGDATLCIAQQHGAIAVVNSYGPGKGRAIRYAIDRVDADILVFMDADGSHNAQDIKKLLQPIVAGDADLVLASRVKGGSDELSGNLAEKIRGLANWISVLLTNFVWRSRLTDVNNGFRAIRGRVAKELNLKEPRFAVEWEMVLKSLKRSKRVLEIPAHESRRMCGASRLNVWMQVLDCARCFILNLYQKRVRETL